MALVVIVATLLPDCLYAPPRTSGPFPSGVYVWQQSWTDDVVAAVAETRQFDRLYVLAAVLRLSPSSGSRVEVVSIPPAVLRSREGVIACVRIYPFNGNFAAEEVVDAVRDAAARAVNALRSGGVVVEELHIDFDAAESQLDAYRGWLDRLRADHPALRLSITALPSWLDRTAFARIVRTVDTYVLQLHSLPKSSGPGGRLEVFDIESATGAVRAAARLRGDFRIALPTYGYELIYDAGGSLRHVVAEGPVPEMPTGGSMRRIRADPVQLSSFVRSLARERPRALEGIVWYRLPVASDRLNWNAKTLEVVRAGGIPRARLQPETRRTAPGLVEIDLVNLGDDEGPPPPLVEVTGRSPIVAADAVNGFVFQRAGHDVVHFRPSTGIIPPLAPGERRTLGWVRLHGDTEVAAHVLMPG